MQLAPKPQGGRPEGFASDTAEKTGVNKSTINRAISRANGVIEEARDAIRGTDLDKDAGCVDANRGPLNVQTN